MPKSVNGKKLGLNELEVATLAVSLGSPLPAAEPAAAEPAPAAEREGERERWLQSALVTAAGLLRQHAAADDKMAQWLPCHEAEAIVRSLGLQSQKDWRDWKGRNSTLREALGVPSNPQQTYSPPRGTGWVKKRGWHAWLGTGPTAAELAAAVAAEQ